MIEKKRLPSPKTSMSKACSGKLKFSGLIACAKMQRYPVLGLDRPGKIVDCGLRI